MKRGARNIFIFGIIFILCLLYVVKFGGPNILRLYIESGMGDCKKIPVLCRVPEEMIDNPGLNPEFKKNLLPYVFPKMKILAPKGFDVVQELVKKYYYKKYRKKVRSPVIYLSYQEPGFLVRLYPRVIKSGVVDNYQFIKRTMYAKITEIKNFQDAFFTIMKGIFIPDIGNQHAARMCEFALGDKRGFLNYNLSGPGHYFDCDITDKEGNFFKVYIKDPQAALGLAEVFTIISSVEAVR